MSSAPMLGEYRPTRLIEVVVHTCMRVNIKYKTYLSSIALVYENYGLFQNLSIPSERAAFIKSSQLGT